MNGSNKLLSDIVAFRTYAKFLPHLGRRESLAETINRNMTMHLDRFPKLSKDIIKSYQRVHDLEVMPSMRAMQFSGEAIIKNHARQYNCSAAPIDDIRAFGEALYLLLSGVGFGFSVQKHHVNQLPVIKMPREEGYFVIHDSIQGWAQALDILMESYFLGRIRPQFDFGNIRPKGSYLVTTGAKAPGPEPLRKMLEMVEAKLKAAMGRKLRPIEAHDIVCIISDAVLAGGIRRAALISLFDRDDEEMLKSKHGEWWNTAPWRARANNSVVLPRELVTKEEFDHIFKMCKDSNSGEPGFFWTNEINYLTNPCCEIALNPNQFCNLTTINQTGIRNEKDFLNRVYAATLIGTLQASYTSFDYLRPVWQNTTEREALLGVSFTGIADNAGIVTPDLLQKGAALALEVNEKYAKKLGINLAARIGTVKPEGCRPWDGLVTTDKGIYTLQEMLVDHDFTSNSPWSETKNSLIAEGNGNKISKTFYNGEEEVFSLNLSGGISLESTKNHLWFIKEHVNSGKGSRVEVKDFIKTENIGVGDVVDLNIGVYKKEQSSLLSSVNIYAMNMSCERFHDITLPSNMSQDLAWLIGYIWADGSVTTNGRVKFFEQDQKIIKKIKSVTKELFNIEAKFTKCKNKNMEEGVISSRALVAWLHKNGIEKYSEDSVQLIPTCVRESSWKDVVAFFAGFADGDGCIRKDKRSSAKNYVDLTLTQKASLFTKHLQDVGMAVGLCFSRSLNAKRNSFGKNPIHLMHLMGTTTERAASVLKSNMAKMIDESRSFSNESISKPNFTLGKVLSITSCGIKKTYDIEVEKEHWFYAGAVKSHNSASCVVGSSSGIHARHAEYYIRRVRMNKDDALAVYLKATIPDLVEDDMFSSTGVVVSIPQESPKGAITRHQETALSLMDRVLMYRKNWIEPTHRSGLNKHNVSVTISVKEEEWGSLREQMWEHRDSYSGISLLPFDGGSYSQAPFEDCTKEKYEEMSRLVKEIDLRLVKEEVDNTSRIEQLACVGGACIVE